MKIRAARKTPIVILSIAFFLLSACGSLAICGCNGHVGNAQKLIQETTSNKIDSTTAAANVTPIIPHMRFEIIRPKYGEVITIEKEKNTIDIDLLAATSIDSCHGDVCKHYGINKVEFFEGLNYLGKVDYAASDCEANTQKCLWKLKVPFAPGTYNLTARATDSENRVETSSQVTFTVKPWNDAPQAVIIRPYDNETFTYPTKILVNVSAWDNDDNITRVEIYEGMNKLDESDDICQKQQNCTYNFAWENADPKIYSLKAVAVDEKGLAGTSSPITIVVKPNKKNVNLEQSTEAEDHDKCNFKSSPGTATLISPNGTVGTRNPTYTWNSVQDSTRYHLMVDSSTKSGVFDKWYDAADLICSEKICSIKPPNQDLSNDGYKWRIQTSNCNTPNGPWSSSMSFRITGSPPSAPMPISPNGLVGTNTPTFTWTASPGSTQYRIQVQNQVGPIINKQTNVDENQTNVDQNQTNGTKNLPVNTVIDEIYEADDVTSGYDCSVISPRALWNGIYYWGVEARNEFGGFTGIDFNNIGSTNYFEIVCSIPRNTTNQINGYVQSLPDDAFQENPVEYRTIISEKLSESIASIESEDYHRAINGLMFVRSRADGSVDGVGEDDWIVDPTAQNEICKLIDDLIANIRTTQGSDGSTPSINERIDTRERFHRQNRNR